MFSLTTIFFKLHVCVFRHCIFAVFNFFIVNASMIDILCTTDPMFV